MIVDCNLKHNKNLHSDICIVGTGPAAMPLINILSELDLSINIIESGSFKNSKKAQSFNESENIGIGNFPVNKWSTNHARIRKIGGTSNIWAGWSGPLGKSDFEFKEWISQNRWDITYEEMHKYYLKSNKIFGFESFEFDKKLFDIIKKSSDIENLLNNNELDYNFWKLKRPPINFGNKFKHLFQKQNINLFFNLTVNEIVSNKENEVDYLIANNFSKKHSVIKANIFVICCGGLENARIILNSTKYESHGIGNKNRTVGKYFMEHPHLILAETNKINNKTFIDLFQSKKTTKSNDKIIPGIYLNDQIQKKYRISNCASVILKHDLLENSFAVIFRNICALKFNPFSIIFLIKNLINNIPKTLNFLKNFILQKNKTYYLYARLEQSPNTASNLTLSDTRDYFGYKQLQLNWNLSKLDIKTLYYNYKIISEFLEKNNICNFKLRKWIAKAFKSGELIFNEKLIYGTGHHMGTTPMSNNPNKGYVDTNLKVHNISNLYISGCSIFPTSGCVNPTYTIVALSIRLGEHLKKKLTKNNIKDS